MAKLPASGFAVARGEGIRKGLGSDTVDGSDEVRIRNRRVSSLDSPHRLAQFTDGGGGVEDDLGAIEPESHPIQGVMAAVTDVDT